MKFDTEWAEPGFALLLILIGLVLINHSSGLAPMLIGFGIGYMGAIFKGKRGRY